MNIQEKFAAAGVLGIITSAIILPVSIVALAISAIIEASDE